MFIEGYEPTADRLVRKAELPQQLTRTRVVISSLQRMRRYIRHPSGVPLSFSVEDAKGRQSSDKAFSVRDVSRGGLCFKSDYPIEPGSGVNIEIQIGSPPFMAHGIVAWCQDEGGTYAVGVQFDDQATRFNVRMVEQVCHIERYRSEIKRLEGRDLSSEEAAREWIDRYAGDFPEYNG